MKTNKFEVEKIKKNKITISEEKDDLSPFLLFWRKYGIIIQSILLFLSVLVFTVGMSLSLAQAYKNATEKHEIIYTLTFYNSQNEIALDSAYPMSDEEATDLYIHQKEDTYGNVYKPHSFSLRNDSSNKLRYIIAIEEEVPNLEKRLRLDVIKYRLYINNEPTQGILSDEILTEEVTNYETGDVFVPSNNYVLARGELNVGENVNYQLMLWLSDFKTTNEDQNKEFYGHIKVYMDYIK